MKTFRVALSGDFRKSDGSPAFPMFDLSKLDSEPNLTWEYIDPVNGRMDAKSLANFDALILLAADFDKYSIPSNKRLRLVARFGVGYDSVDVKACSEEGIGVAITPDGVRRPVAASILGFILALSSNMFAKDRLVRGGPERFNERNNFMGLGLVGRTLGSLGIGNIGAEMFRICKPLDMQFIAYDPFVDESIAKELNVKLVDLEEVFEMSDFLALNTPLTKDTHHIVNADRLAKMKPTAYLINTSRGPVLDQSALVKVLKNRGIAGAALDVFDPEPPAVHDQLLGLENVILAPHSICWTDQCFAQIGASDVAQIVALKQGEIPAHLVNPEVTSHPEFKLALREYKSRL